MHQPDSDHKIETVVDGERVRGTVHYTGSADITVRLDEPSDWTNGLHMPYFARGVHPEGFLGAYGEQRALDLLIELYKEHKRGERRRKFADADFEEFGRIRYLAVNPGHPAFDRKIREQAPIDSTIYVQIEEDGGPYGVARFFDSGTNQPFLAEAAVYDDNIQKYIDGVKADLTFRRHLKTIRRKLLPDMQQKAERLRAHKLSPRQVNFLSDFGRFWRAGEIPLDAAEVGQLIDFGYLIRDHARCANEIATLDAAINRSRTAQERLEAEGKHQQAAQCAARIRKLQQRIEMKALMITPTGKAVAQDFPGDFDPGDFEE